MGIDQVADVKKPSLVLNFFRIHSLYFILSSLFSIPFTTWNWYVQWIAESATNIEAQADFIDLALKNGEVAPAIAILRSQFSSSNIHYYALIREGLVLSQGNSAPDEPVLGFENTLHRKWTNFLGRRHLAFRSGPYEVLMGQRTSFWYLVWCNYLNVGPWLLGLAFFYLVSNFLLLNSVFTRILASVKSLRSPSSKKLDPKNYAYAETSIASDILRSQSADRKALLAEIASFRSQLTPAQLYELNNQDKKNYEFGCTAVRFDLNGYTAAMSSAYKSDFLRAMDELFEPAKGIIAKYGGLLKERIADEMIFIVRDDAYRNSAAPAVMALREILIVAETLDKRCVQKGFSFRLKCVVARGTLSVSYDSLGELSTSGQALIVAQRMLSSLEKKDKDRTLVLLNEAAAQVVGHVVEVKKNRTVSLVDIPGQQNLYSLERVIPLQNHLDVLGGKLDATEWIETVSLYRRPEEVSQIIDWIQSISRQGHERQLYRLLYALASFELIPGSSMVVSAFERLVDSLIFDAQDEARRTGAVLLLSQAARLAPKLLADPAYHEKALKILRELQTIPYLDRAISNAIESVGDMSPTNPREYLVEAATYLSNRNLANAIVVYATTSDWTFAVKNLELMLESDDSLKRASGLYALEQIVVWLAEREPGHVLFANEEIQKCISIAEELLDDEDKVVRPRASITVSTIRKLAAEKKQKSAG